jgi:outer membrane protein assembly factor BamB
VYWADWVGNVHAQKITDGTEVWNPAVKFARGFTSSPFVTEDKLFLSDRDNLVVALDRLTGKQLWRTPISDNPLAQIWSSPTVADGVVVVGLGCKGSGNGASNDGTPWLNSDLMAFRGAVVGLDAATGEVRWRFEVTKADGMSYGPGVSVWSSAALDTGRKVAYIGTGNSYYSPASPYSDSLLALNYMTTKPEGELVWHQQFTKDDNFTAGMPIGPDSDVGATPNLFSFDGKDYVAVGDKGGWVYVLDRESGQTAFPRVAAGSGAGTGTSTRVGVIAPAAYADGVLYVTANYSGATRVLAIDIASGMTKWSAMDQSGVSFGAPLLLKDVLLIGTTNGSPSSMSRGSELHAFRRADGSTIAWRLPIKNQRGGGISIYRNTLFVPYGYVFENRRAEDGLTGGVLVAALGGKVVEPGPAGPVVTYAPTFKAIYTEIFAEKGCTMDFCHGGSGLQLGDPATARMNLLQATSTGTGCSGMPYVVPGKPDESYLYNKLQPSPKCGRQMPDGLQPLTPEAMTQIRTWIEMGAPDN